MLLGVLSMGIDAPAYAQCNPGETAKFLASDGALSDYFGNSVSITGLPGQEIALIGAPGHNVNGNGSGLVYVFANTNGVWTRQAKLHAADAALGDRFGEDVSITGSPGQEVALIGAPRHNDNGNDSGSVYVFANTNGVWRRQAKLLAADGSAGDRFGNSVTITGLSGREIALIGAVGDDDNGNDSGSVYVFANTNGVWTQQSKLLAGDGAMDDVFGGSLSTTGFPGEEVALIGAAGNDDNGANSGSVYVFVNTDGVWTQQQKLLAADGAAGDQFGQSVSITGPLGQEAALIGAPLVGPETGAAYIFVHTDGVWSQQQKLLAGNWAVGDRFGKSVSITGLPGQEVALIGVPNYAISEVGSVFVFVHTGGVWTQQSRFLPADWEAGDQFGKSISITGLPGEEVALIGAFKDNDSGFNSGSAYVINIQCSHCLADIDNNGQLNFFDVVNFLTLYLKNDLFADFTGDGNFDFFDISAFLAAYSAGCP